MSLIGTKIEPFTATAYQAGDFLEIANSQLNGRWSVLFFCPADFTFVCPTELEDLADNHEAFIAANIDIYSVSTDTHFSHKAWHDSSPSIAKIEYPMIADPTGRLTRSFDNLRDEQGLADRGTFLIDPDGVIQLIEITAEGVGRSATELLRKAKAAIHVRDNPGVVCPARWVEGAPTLTPGPDLVGKI